VQRIRVHLYVIFIICLTFLPLPAAAQGRPPANVVVSAVTSGTIAPQEQFIGTVYYPEVAVVSAEVNGTAKTVLFDEGDRTPEGTSLVTLDSDILKKTLQARQASHEEVLATLARARKNLDRSRTLYHKKIIAEKEFDDQSFLVSGLEKKAASLKAEVERLEIELKKSVITAPFAGVIIKKHVSRGEWLSPGAPVATIARDDTMDVIVEVPETMIRYLHPGLAVTIQSGGKEFKGTLNAVIPRGDIATRTFPVKIRINNKGTLIEGMQAVVTLPVGENITVHLVPRDAILTTFGTTVIVAVVDGAAKVIPTKVTGYQGTNAGINSQDIVEGMHVIVKGNERLRDGQPVNILREIE
jgi:membrane fusion protein (multidrug efflux system)